MRPRMIVRSALLTRLVIQRVTMIMMISSDGRAVHGVYDGHDADVLLMFGAMSRMTRMSMARS
eukprot:9541751-Lingulodinium_polyedra.AAC.1